MTQTQFIIPNNRRNFIPDIHVSVLFRSSHTIELSPNFDEIRAHCVQKHVCTDCFSALQNVVERHNMRLCVASVDSLQNFVNQIADTLETTL